MRHLTALLPQHEKPWSHALAEQSAFTSYGTSTAAAVVACIIFFLFLCGAATNSFYTKYLMYEVLCAATACKSPLALYGRSFECRSPTSNCTPNCNLQLLASVSVIENLICAVVRTVAFGVRAAYTVHYRPALEGVWVAFNNAGFGANVATLSLVLGTWYVMTLFRPCHSALLAQACWCNG